MSGGTREITVDPERVGRWVAGCEARHGALGWLSPEAGAVRLVAADGFAAELRPLLAGDGRPDDVASLERWFRPDAELALLLVRRGGYAVGVARGPELVAHKVGTRHVQSRTAAGGWSQQRFARRRGHQADALVAAVQDHAARILAGASPEGLVVGGDRTLVGEVLADPRLRGLPRLQRASLYDLPDPRLAVLRGALERGRAVRVRLSDPLTEAGPDPS